jgi:hypothetical protein
MKTKDAYTNTMVQLAKLEAKVDVLLKMFAEIKADIDKSKPRYVPPETDLIKRWEDATRRQFGGQTQSDTKCIWENMSAEDRMKPMGLSCPCIKCSAYCLTRGSLSDPGFVQQWREPLNDNDPEE